MKTVKSHAIFQKTAAYYAQNAKQGAHNCTFCDAKREADNPLFCGFFQKSIKRLAFR
jgi:hypothetical protein